MKNLLALALLCSISGSAQIAKPHHAVVASGHLSEAFSKLALRAMLALKGEDCNDKQAINTTDLFINDADIEAKSKAETQVIADLQTVQGLNVFNSVMRGLNLQAKASSASLHDRTYESALKEYNSDPATIFTSKQDQTCQSALEASLRKRIYSPLPSICSQSTPTAPETTTP